jgi:pyruvate dehydrogenase E1 component
VGFRERFDLNVSDEVLETVTFVQPPADSPEIRYMHERRQALGGYLPQRRVKYEPLTPPGPSFIDLYRKGSVRSKDPSTTMVFVDQLKMLLKDKGRLGKYLVPIIPDEARTFGMESYFADFKIYASQGQKYVPVDDDTLAAYREAKDGQVLEEGINEAGAISSFIAAGTSYATHGVPMCPFYIYLLHVRVPTDRRPNMGGCRLALPWLPVGSDGRPDHAQRGRAAARRRS